MTDIFETLSMHLTGSPNPPSQNTEEYWLMEHLDEIIEGFEIGTYTRQEVRDIFSDYKQKLPDFDIDLWIDEQIAKGVYEPDDENET